MRARPGYRLALLAPARAPSHPEMPHLSSAQAPGFELLGKGLPLREAELNIEKELAQHQRSAKAGRSLLKQVEALLERLEQATRRRAIVSTPNWPAYRPGHETILGFSDREAHPSYVPRRVSWQRGFRIIGAGLGNPTNRSQFVRVLRKLAPRRRHALDSPAQVLLPITEPVVALKGV